ncbi:MAG TPA: S-layer homology domain-containing protein [Thermoanaerobaculia bacterium]|nr:S-layer homology domain-containing protein [Thermoanaerobaculia bacterium]
MRARRKLCIGACLVWLGAAPLSAVTTYLVTNTNASGPGSFAQAILDANANPGADVIQFDIPGSGVQTILLSGPLPAVTDPLLIDGYSQPGSQPNTDPVADNAVLQIEILGSGGDGLTILAGSSIVQGLILNGFDNALTLSDSGGDLVQGNFIGTDAAGAAAVGSFSGITITAGGTIDRIGDSNPAARNLISGNIAGIQVSGSGSAKILGNLIGTDAGGSFAVGNVVGIYLSGSANNQVGGVNAGEPNVVSGNAGEGIDVEGSSNDVIQGNLIGTDATGEFAVANGDSGIRVQGVSEDFTIASNVVSGNIGPGIELNYGSLGTIVQDQVVSNLIGADFHGTSPIPNGVAGIRIDAGDWLRIFGNAIFYNPIGLWRTSPSTFATVVVTKNSFRGNHGLAIVLGPDPTIAPNSPGSAFNFPFVTSVTTDGTSTTIAGVYAGPPNTNVTIELFRSPACSRERPADFEEGLTWFDTVSAPTDGAGNLTFEDTVFGDFTADRITATATTFLPPLGPEGGVLPTSETSEFSQRLPFAIAPRSGPASGGTPVTITGTSFAPAAALTIGGQAAGGAVVADANQITATAPALAPGAAYDVSVANPDDSRGTIPLAFVADFLDVPPAQQFHDFVVTLVENGVSAGIGGGNYGVNQPVLRQQMAVFLLKSEHGVCYVPPTCRGAFDDVPCPSAFADWIEALAQEGITSGCGNGDYCPLSPVRRDQMAVFLLKAERGSGYSPPACSGVFLDVPCSSPFAPWIEQLAAENITSGCGGGNYCPGNDNTRGQMAVFVVKTFGLP